MAILDQGRAHAPGRTVSFGNWLSRALAALAEWNEARQTREALYRLNDRELDDIGLTRYDIERVARGEFPRR